jgi:hypothetical protein
MLFFMVEIPFMKLKFIFNCFLYNNHMITIDLDVWKQEDDMIIDLFQPPKDELSHILMMIFGHILGGLIHIILSTWIYSMKKIFNHRCAPILMRVRT